MASPSPSSVLPVVKMVEQCRVSPSVDGLPAGVGVVSVPLTFLDVIFMYQRVDRLYFYRWPGITTPYFAATALPRLKSSLSLALRHYFPLAGRLSPPQPAPSADDRFHILCTGSDSVPFTLAEVLGDVDQCPSFDQLAGDQPRIVEAFHPLVPEIPTAAADGESGLTALQVTVFPGGGFCVGVSIHHAACDGSGFTNFVKAWASICRSLGEEMAASPVCERELPVIDRALVSDPRGLYAVFRDMIARADELKWEAPILPNGATMVLSTFHLRRVDIEELRRQVSEQRAPPEVPHSSFVLTTAYVWVCLLRAAVDHTPLPPKVGDAAHLAFAVDCRRRLNPLIPLFYFGNCLCICSLKVHREDLLSEQDGVGRAADAIASAVGSLGYDGRVLDDAEDWISRAASSFPSLPLSIAGSPWFKVYDTDFGWGRPTKVEMPAIAKTGAMSLAENRDGEGGVEIGLVLPQGVLAKFSSLFAAGLKV